jgi:hypothetical protein
MLSMKKLTTNVWDISTGCLCIQTLRELNILIFYHTKSIFVNDIIWLIV